MHLHKKQISEDKIDLLLQVNYLSPVYLTSLIFPLLLQSDQPRIINISSFMHKFSLFGDLPAYNQNDFIFFDKNFANDKKVDYEWMQNYSRSKLYNAMFTQALSIFNRKIKSVSVDPG